MAQSDFEQGFLTALSSFAIKGEGGGSSDGGLPDRSNLRFINCDYFRGSTGEGLAYLSDTRYNSVFSSSFDYVPSYGAIVMMGSYQLVDWDDTSGETPRAMMRITADNVVIYEGEVSSYFDKTTVEKARAFNYKETFNIEAKRLNLTDSMCLEIYSTAIIGCVPNE